MILLPTNFRLCLKCRLIPVGKSDDLPLCEFGCAEYRGQMRLYVHQVLTPVGTMIKCSERAIKSGTISPDGPAFLFCHDETVNFFIYAGKGEKVGTVLSDPQILGDYLSNSVSLFCYYYVTFREILLYYI